MDITIRIECPEIVGALNNLANALMAGAQFPQINGGALDQTVIEQPQQQPQPQPQQQPQQQQPPIQTYVAPPAQPVQPVQPVQQQPPVTPPRSYSADELARAAGALADAGKRNEVVALINSFGVQALTMLPKERYGDFAQGLRSMGAKL